MIATQPTALAGILATQFRMNQFIVRANVDGITHEESLIRAVPGGNNMNWTLGHVVATRSDLMAALGRQPVWDDSRTRLYRRGMAAAEHPEHLPFDEVVRAFHASQDRLVEGISSLTDEDLAAPAPFSPGGGPETLGGLLTKSAIHEAYHLGQTGILRRVAGKSGAIR